MSDGSDPYKLYHFLKECNQNFSVFIYVNCFNRLRFLAEVSTKLQKNALFGQFKDHISGRQHETRQITPFFLSTFFCSKLFVNIHFGI